MSDPPSAHSEVGIARWLLLTLAALAMAGTALELAMERHWDGFIKLIPWFALGVLVAALLLVAVRPSPLRILVSRVLCIAVVGASVFGIYEHVNENHKAGPLDYRYAETWNSMSSTEQWWKAATKTVGPAPVLAAGVLSQAALAIMAATAGHPASKRTGHAPRS